MTERLIPSIDNRLTAWAEYIERAKRGDAGTGRSVIASLIDNQGVIVRSSAAGASMPDTIYDTDRAVRRVEETDAALGQVIREHYQNLHSTREQKQAACGCSERTYYRRLGQAHHAVLMLLSVGKRSTSASRVQVRLLKKAG